MKIEEAIVDARRNGLSVAETARILKWKPGTVHDLLRNLGEIDPIKRRDKPADVTSVHSGIIRGLRNQELSLERWAHGRGFRLEEAIEHLSVPCKKDIEDSKLLHFGLCSDFPNLYRGAFGSYICEWVKAPMESDEHPDLVIAWNHDKRLFVGRFPSIDIDGEGPAGAGFDRAEALAEAEKALRVQRQIRRLEAAVVARRDLDDKLSLNSDS